MMRQRRSPDKKRSAIVAVLLACCLTVIVAVLAIALDGGALQSERRHAQATADAAALAAAASLWRNFGTDQGADPYGSAVQAALNLASANGYDNDGVTSTVTVNIPPGSGSYAGKAGYVEVIVAYQQTRSFSAALGSGTLAVGARAVACGIPNDIGILILDPSSTDTCEIDGKVNILGNGQIVVNSSDSAAVRLYDLANLTASAINVVGSPGVQNNVGSGSLHALVNTDVPAISDPLANVPEPVPSGTNYGDVTCTGNATLQPGVYQSITVQDGANVTLQPGIYYLSGPSSSGSLGGLSPGNQSGGIAMGSGATMTGNGVMIYNQSGDNLNFINAGAIRLTPPTSGTYQGISIFQPRSDSMEIHLVSSNEVTISGTLYAEAGSFDLRPMGSSVFNMANYICNQFEACQGGRDFGEGGGTTGTLNLTPSGGAATKTIRLVE